MCYRVLTKNLLKGEGKKKMKMLKKFRCLVLAMILILVTVFCTTFAAVKPIKLVFGHVWAASHFFCKGDLYFKKLVEKNSKGQILIDYFPAGQLGNHLEEIQATMSGAQQLHLVSPGGLLQNWSKLGSFTLPYIFRDANHLKKVANKFNSLIDPDEMAAKLNMHVLAVRISPARHLTTKFPVNKIEDIKGLKMRVPQSPINMAYWKAVGTIPTAIPAADIYTSLATGLVDAQENPLNDIYVWKLYEQQKYCALVGWFSEMVMTVINNNCWKSLTAKQQKIISDAAKKSAEMGFKDAQGVEKKYQELLAKKGMKFTKPNVGPFREKAKSVWKEFGDEELIEKIQAIK
jgi:tripartite ATP-independent transporter DctP family solute receptor